MANDINFDEKINIEDGDEDVKDILFKDTLTNDEIEKINESILKEIDESEIDDLDNESSEPEQKKSFDENDQEYGSYLFSTSKFIDDYSLPVYTPKEEKDVFKRLKAGDDSVREDIIRHNVRLVAKCAAKYERICSSLTFDDLLMEGFFGLNRAIDLFDAKKGCKFSTYASIWIRQAVQRAATTDDSIIKLPVHANEKIYKYEHAKNDEEREELLQKYPFLKDALNYTTSVVSLDAPVSEDEDEESVLGDFITLETALNSGEKVMNDELREKIFELIDNFVCQLNNDEQKRKRNKDIIIRRFGLNGNDPEGLQSIGSSYGITRERVRQIEVKFIRFCRTPKRAKELKNFDEVSFERFNKRRRSYETDKKAQW